MVEVLARRLEPEVVSGHAVSVPPHFDVEVIAGIRGLSQRGLIDASAAQLGVDRHLVAPFVRVFDERDVRGAWSLRGAWMFDPGPPKCRRLAGS